MKQILLFLHKHLYTKGFHIMGIILMGALATTGCGHKTSNSAEGPVKITKINTAHDVTMATNADVTERSYTFNKVPLLFSFNDNGASYLMYGENRTTISNLFYTREMAQKNAPNLAGNTIDRDNFMDEPARNTLMAAAQITAGSREYVLCVFDKQQFSIGPLDHYYYYLIDVTDKGHLSPIAFISLAEEGDYIPKIYAKGGKICVPLTYYSHLKAGDYTTETVVVTEGGSGKWVME